MVRCNVDRDIATVYARWGQGDPNLCTFGNWTMSMKGGGADKVWLVTLWRTELDVVSRTIRGGVYIFMADDIIIEPWLTIGLLLLI